MLCGLFVRCDGVNYRFGFLHVGADADIVVLDSRAKPSMELRMRVAGSLAEELFILQTMGDDRSVAEAYVAGKPMKHSAIAVKDTAAAAARSLETA